MNKTNFISDLYFTEKSISSLWLSSWNKHNLLTWENTFTKSKLKDILQNTWPVISKDTRRKLMKFEQSMESS